MIALAENWWLFVLRGIAAVIFGVLTFLMPGVALLTLVFMFGIYAMADGILAIASALRRSRSPDDPPWWAVLILGIVSILAGIAAFLLPGPSAFALLMVMAAWMVVSGAFQIVAAVRLRKQIRGEWVMALSGLLGIVTGTLIAIFPGPGVLAMLIWIGAFAFVYGILLIVLGVRLRSFRRRTGAAAVGRHTHDIPPGAIPAHN